MDTVNNRLDFGGIRYLCDSISVCTLYPQAPTNTLMFSNHESISTTEMNRYIAKELSQSAHLFLAALRVKFLADLIGKAGNVERPTRNSQIDIIFHSTTAGLEVSSNDYQVLSENV